MNEIYSPGVLSVLPLFYVGWSDSVLGPSEQALIHEKIDAMPQLSEADKELLKSWTDQNNPPSQEVFKNWSHSLKRNRESWAKAQKDQLISMGIEMARKATASGDFSDNKLVYSALKGLEEVLGVNEGLDASILEKTLHVNAQESGENQEDVGFTASDINFFLDGKRRVVMDKIISLISDPSFDNTDIRSKEEYRERILTQCKILTDHNASNYPFPAEYGGNDDTEATTVVFETLSYGDISLLIKFGVQFGLFGGSIHMLGTKRHHDKYLLKPLRLMTLLQVNSSYIHQVYMQVKNT